MPKLSRRTFIAGTAALAAKPAFAAPELADVPVAVIGAGAAGIAAARRLAAAKVKFAFIEAGGRIGGRCVTDTGTFSASFDRGAHWIHRQADNPLLQLANGFDVYSAPRGQSLRVPPRRAREGELEEFLASLVRANRAIVEAGRGRGDVTASAALPKDLGVWRDSVEFVLGPYSTGKALSDVSAADFSRAPERNADAFCREGYGVLLAKLAAGLPVQLSTPAQRLDWGGALTIETPKGTIRARTAVVTVSTAVLAGGGLRFTPDLPGAYRDAIASLSLGQSEQIALEIPGNPFDLERDDLVFEKVSGNRTAALLANVGGSSLCVVSVGGSLARELSKTGEAALTDFAADWLSSMFGTATKKLIKRSAATRWGDNPLVGGAFSGASPGRADARRVLAQSLRDRVWFAGEAAHESLYGTVNGAWESGTRAAEAALRVIGGLPATTGADKNEPRKRKRR